MSATSSNTNPRIPAEAPVPVEQPRQTAAYYAPGRESLQALLAFSSLHDQIRRRRTQALGLQDHAGLSGRTERFVPDEVLQLISERALAITGTDGVAIALAEGTQVFCRAAAGEIAPDVGVRLDPNSGFSGACFRSGLIVRCDDTEKDPRVDQMACRRIGVRSIVAVPLVTEQGVVGLVAAFCRETHGVSDGDIRSLSLLAELALAALQPEENLPPSKPQTMQQEEATRQAEIEQAVPFQEYRTNAEPNSSTDTGQRPLPNLDSLRHSLSPVIQERGITNEGRLDGEPGFWLPQQEEEAPKTRRTWVAVLIAVCVTLALAGAAFWWWFSRRTVSPSARPAPAASKFGPATGTAAGAALQTGNDQLPAVSKDVPTRQIVGIRHWSSPDSCTVAIDLQNQVQYEAHRLSNPERIYFDLRDTTLAGGIPGNMDVDDALLSRIRVAQPTADLTRVVLETKNSPKFSVKLENNPYRLLIEIRSSTAKPKTDAKVDLFAPVLEDNKNTRASSATPEQGTWLAPAETAQRSGTPLAEGRGLKIVLDAGHGGWDMGTVGRKGLLEKDLVLDIVARLGQLVTSRLGAEVVYTRRDDTYVALEKRTEAANLSHADLFLSVHANYSDLATARGVETYYTNTYSSARSHPADVSDTEAPTVNWLNVDIREKVQESRGLANDVQQALYHTLAAKNPALRNRGVKEASYVVLTGTTMPAILAEVSFVSSPEDENKLENSAYRQQIAEGLYKGIAAYSEAQHRVNVATASSRTAGQ